MEINKYYSEWKKQFSTINKANLEYVTIGGFAMVLYGLPRATVDVDITIPSDKKQLLKIGDIASRLGYSYDKALETIAINTPHAIGQCLTLKDKSEIFHLDIFITSKDEFKTLKNNSKTFKFDNIPIVVASLKDIKILKRKTNREIDRADIELIDKKLKGVS